LLAQIAIANAQELGSPPTSALGCGCFDAPAGFSAVQIRRGNTLMLDGPLFGSGAVGGSLFGVTVDEGAQFFITTAVTPTLTNTAGELQMDGSATAIPPLVAGAAVPAASALATWADWAAAPFSRNVVSYKSGAKIITVNPPV